MSPLRRPTGGRAAGRLAAGLGAVFLALAVSAPAEAAGYRYWSFWENQGRAWGYATQGPATARPADGDVIGFRFAVSKDSSDASRPTTAPDFAAVCKGVEKKDGTKRVAVVVDFGGPTDAPPGETPPKPVLRTGCPEVREDATAAEALAAVAKPLRYDSNALLCGIAGYPAKGCGEQVALPEEQPGGTAKPSATAAATGTSTGTASGTSTGTDAGTGTGTASGSDSGGPSVGLVVGGAAVVLLGTAGVVRARRRRG